MAKTYRRPLISFYFEAPPPKADRGEDFRSLPNRTSDSEPIVDAVLRDVRARQAMVRSLMEEEESATRLQFIGSMAPTDGIGPVLSSIVSTIGIDRVEFRSQGSREAAFAYLRLRAERSGIFVLLIGNLGSHHTNLDVAAFRGFALADEIAPFIVINDQDARAAWSFTLLHELVHVWIGATGVSGLFGESAREQFCNDVASEFLLPANELGQLTFDDSLPIHERITAIGEFANQRLISRSLVAYRLFRAGLASRDSWSEMVNEFREQWRQLKRAEQAQARERAGGPNYYVVRRNKVGAALLGFVDRTLSEGLLTATKASKVLGVKARSVAPMLSVIRRQRA